MLVTLAETKKVISTVVLGKQMLVSPKYLRKLAGPMEKKQLIKSIQGIYGGYLLGKKAGEITIADVFNAFREKIKISDCLSGSGCPLDEKCLTKPVWVHLDKIIEDEFYHITIDNILKGTFG